MPLPTAQSPAKERRRDMACSQPAEVPAQPTVSPPFYLLPSYGWSVATAIGLKPPKDLLPKNPEEPDTEKKKVPIQPNESVGLWCKDPLPKNPEEPEEETNKVPSQPKGPATKDGLPKNPPEPETEKKLTEPKGSVGRWLSNIYYLDPLPKNPDEPEEKKKKVPTPPAGPPPQYLLDEHGVDLVGKKRAVPTTPPPFSFLPSRPSKVARVSWDPYIVDEVEVAESDPGLLSF